MPSGPRNPSRSRLGKEHELPARLAVPGAASLPSAHAHKPAVFFFPCPLSYPHPGPPASSSQNSLPLDSRKWLVQLCNQIPLNPFVYCACPSAPPRCPSRLGLGQVTENSGSAGGGPGTVPGSQNLREQVPPTASRQPSQLARPCRPSPPVSPSSQMLVGRCASSRFAPGWGGGGTRPVADPSLPPLVLGPGIAHFPQPILF